MKKKQILIAVKEKLIREIWSGILNDAGHFKVISTTPATGKILPMVKKYKPAVVITDVREIQLALLNFLKPGKKQVHCRALFILTTVIPSFASRLLNTGVMGIITKNVSLDEMVFAISEVSENRRYTCSEISLISEAM